MATMAAAAPVFKQPQPVNPNSLPFFSRISEDLLVNVFSRLEQDPRDLARLACVCRRFTYVIKISCWRHQCLRVVPTIVSELMHTPVTAKPHELLGEPPCGWGSLQKLLVCCPGLRLAGVLLDSWDFGLERELGDSFHYEVSDDVSDAVDEDRDACIASENPVSSESPVNKKQVQEQEPERGLERGLERGRGRGQEQGREQEQEQEKVETPVVRKMKEHIGKAAGGKGPVKHMKQGGSHYYNKMMEDERIVSSYRRTGVQGGDGPTLRTSLEFMHTPRVSKTVDVSAMVDDSSEPGCNHKDPHLAKGSWSLTREQGNKLLASRSAIIRFQSYLSFAASLFYQSLRARVLTLALYRHM